MDRAVLKEYVDICEHINELQHKIHSLQKKKSSMAVDSVHGSMPEFPYAPKRFRIEGVEYSVKDQAMIAQLQLQLQKRIDRLQTLKNDYDIAIVDAPARIQRIIWYKYGQDEGTLTWAEVAAKMGKQATADSVRKELERFLEKK